MNSKLKELYDIDIDYYEEKEDGIVFFINDSYYYFINIDIDENYVYSCYEISNKYRNRIPFHSFVFNRHNRLIEDGYVLFRLNTFDMDINYDDVLKYLILVPDGKSFDMVDYWEKKIDYLESKNSNITYYDYYLGIAEMLLVFLSRQSKNDDMVYLSHRTFYNLSSLLFYNPLNIIYDYYYRDIASYISITKDYDVLERNLSKRMSNYLYCYFFARLCFPFTYFHLLSINEEEYDNYLLKIEDYFHIPLFSFIKKRN